MFYVYVLITQAVPAETYVGMSREFPDKRLSEHNVGMAIATRDKGPWGLLAYFAYRTEAQAVAFEKYLKSGMGRVFMKKWLFDTAKPSIK